MWHDGEFELDVDGDVVVDGKDCLIEGTVLVCYEDDGGHWIEEVNIMLRDEEGNDIGRFDVKDGPVFEAVRKAYEDTTYLCDAIVGHQEDRANDYEEWD